MPATYVEITKEQIAKHLEPQGFQIVDLPGGEIVYSKLIAPNVCIRVFTSVWKGVGYGKAVGEDAIRTVLVYRVKSGKIRGWRKARRVNRTQNWRLNLQERIESLQAFYKERESIAAKQHPTGRFHYSKGASNEDLSKYNDPDSPNPLSPSSSRRAVCVGRGPASVEGRSIC